MKSSEAMILAVMNAIDEYRVADRTTGESVFRTIYIVKASYVNFTAHCRSMIQCEN